MRICFVSFEYPPFAIGGAGVYALHITRELAKMGHEVHVISPSIRGQRTHSIESNVFVDRIPIIDKRFLKAPSFWFNLARRYNEVRKDAGGFDIIHSNVVSDFSLSKQKVKEPRVVTVHHLACSVAQSISFIERLFELDGESGLTPTFEKHVIHRADKIIAVSDFTKNNLISSYHVPPSRIEVIYNGIYPADFAVSPEEALKARKLFDSKNKTAFLFVGRVDDKRKGLPLLLEALSILSKKEKSAKLIIVGSGDQTHARALAGSLGLKKSVVFTGFVSDTFLRMIYCACDIFVSPSLLEGFGLNLIEAMAAGKPIIAFNVGAIPELVKDGLNGRVLSRRNSNELSEAMHYFIKNSDLARKIGAHNRVYATEKFNWKTTARITENLYTELLCKRR